MSADARFHAVFSLLQQRRLPEAEALCRELPEGADAVHLLGLIRKESGDLPAAESLLRKSLELEPGRADFHVNFGNLMRRLARLEEAESAYRAALARKPAHHGARLGLARTLNDLGRSAEAERESRTLVNANPRDPQSWSALAMALRDQDRAAEAEQAYRQALAVDPAYAPAHHNLALLLVNAEKTEEALAELDAAQRLGLRGFEVNLVKARALVQLGRFDEAEAVCAEAVRIAPDNPDGQLLLARLRYMRGDPYFARDLAATVARQPENMRLQMLLADVVRRSGDLANAEALLRDLLSRFEPQTTPPELRSALATVLQEAGRLREAEAEALAAATARPGDPVIIQNLVAILLGLGRADEALPFIRTERQRRPLDQSWVAYEASAARLLGDPSYESLYDYSSMVRIYEVPVPRGWSSIEAFNKDLLEALRKRHTLAMAPLEQSLRNGTQTARNLVTDPDPVIQAAIAAFREPIEDYRAKLGYSDTCVLRSRNRGASRVLGCWSVQLRRGGFHVNHIHPEGWLSSAYYVHVPPETADTTQRSGWLKFGEPRLPIPGAHPERVVEPKSGRLVLFPSYMWHGTTPIHGDEPRTTVAFDIVTSA